MASPITLPGIVPLALAALLTSGQVSDVDAADKLLPHEDLDRGKNLFWPHYNRQVSAYRINQTNTYQEADTTGRATSGVLDSEASSGSALTGLGAYLRWQGYFATVPLWTQIQTQTTSGQTDYNGYIQSGNGLAPYAAKTGNQWQTQALRIGVPLALDEIFGLPMHLQVVPTVQWQKGRWKRHLAQYAEAYAYVSRSYGALAQWHPMPSAGPGLVLYTSWQSATHGQTVEIEVPSLGFASRQAVQRMVTIELGMSYQVTPMWGVQICTQTTQGRAAASPVVNGLQAPPSRTDAALLRLGVNLFY